MRYVVSALVLLVVSQTPVMAQQGYSFSNFKVVCFTHYVVAGTGEQIICGPPRGWQYLGQFCECLYAGRSRIDGIVRLVPASARFLSRFHLASQRMLAVIRCSH
jgi:hypothetical protein